MSADDILAEWVDAAAKAMWETSGTRTHNDWELEHPYIREEWWDAAREALEVVAPMIAAQAVPEASVVISRTLLEELLDPDPCWYDHHGGCQAHGYISLRPGERCPVSEGWGLLADRQAAADRFEADQ